MTELVWSPRALADVQRVYRFILGKNPDAARRAAAAIRSAAQTIKEHPKAGRPVDTLPHEFREWIIPFATSGYVMIYHFDGQTVVILAVRHQKEAGY
jgi:addiction module RelE/StbE family toxin